MIEAHRGVKSVSGVGTSDMMTDDTAPLVHEEARRESFNRNTSREPEEVSSGGSEPKRMRTACLRVSSVNVLQKRSTRSETSIVGSRKVHIKTFAGHWRCERLEL